MDFSNDRFESNNSFANFVLESIGVFLDSVNFNLFMSKTEIIKLKKGKLLTQKNRIEKNIYFLKEGVVEYYRIIDRQDELHKQTMQISLPNEVIGEFESFLMQAPSTINIMALKDVELLSISYSNLKSVEKS